MLRLCLVNALLLAAACAGFAQQVTSDCGVRGTITDENGAPIPGLFLTAYSSSVEQGGRNISIAGMATTDASGAYCMHIQPRAPAGLVRVTPNGPVSPPPPLPVFVIATQWFNFKQPNAPSRGTPPTWYPGVPDFRSAKPVMPGSDARADFELSTQRTFTITGTLTGLPPQDEIEKMNDWSETPEGIRVQNGVADMNLERGTFSISGVFPGDWTFGCSFFAANKLFEARFRQTVDRDIHDAVLVFSSGVDLTFEVDGQPYQPGGHDFFVIPYKAGEPVNGGHRFSGLLPGTYRLIVPVPIPPVPFRCVESFSPGDVPLENGNLIISSRQYKQPISLNVGGHCASLTIKLPQGAPPQFNIVLLPESLPFQVLSAPVRYAPVIRYPWPLSPGTYKVYAFTTLDGFDYENPDVLSRFSGQSVVLEADKNTQVTLNVVNTPH